MIMKNVSFNRVWKTIKLGTSRKPDEFLRVMKKRRKLVGEEVEEILCNPAFTVAPEEVEVKLVLLTIDELGFDGRYARGKDLYGRAFERGLIRCTAEVGPQLRIQYNRQPYDEGVIVAMDPIIDSGGFPNVFYLERHSSGSPSLGFENGHLDRFWKGSEYKFVFVSPLTQPETLGLLSLLDFSPLDAR